MFVQVITKLFRWMVVRCVLVEGYIPRLFGVQKKTEAKIQCAMIGKCIDVVRVDGGIGHAL